MSAVFTGREEGAVNVITLYADTYGMASNRTREAGVVASYTRNYIFKTIDAEYAIFDFYAGAGAASGYVHDFERGFFNKTNIELTRERSVMAALSGNIGAHAEFGRRLSLELSFRADVGIAMRRNRSNGAMLLSFYKNGIFQTLYPQLTLLFRL